MNIRIGTHDGSFHEDDVFAVACLRIIYPGAEVVRTRDKSILATCDIVIDVGDKYDGVRYFDHHMEGAPIREDGVPYSSAGLVWKAYGSKVVEALIPRAKDMGVSNLDNPEYIASIWERMVDPIDHFDNGITFDKFGVAGLKIVSSAFLPSWKLGDNEDVLYTRFNAAVAYMEGQILIEILRTSRRLDNEDATVLIDQSVKVSEHDPELRKAGIVVLERWLPSTNKLVELGKNFIIHPKGNGVDWILRALPPEPRSFDKRVPLPARFGGLSNDDLARATGLKDSVFCHRGQFLYVSKSKESCLKMAHIALREKGLE